MIYAQLYFYDVLFKVSALSVRTHTPYILKPSGFQQKAAYSQHFTTARACLGYRARPNCFRELYPLCSNFKSNGRSLKRQLPRNLRSRTFEGGFKPGYPPQAPVQVPQRRELAATWVLNKDIRIMSFNSNDILS